MRKSISLILGELNSKMGGYVSLLYYRYLNLCVKAEVASLLPVTIELDEETQYDLEKVADVSLVGDEAMTVYPKDGSLLYDIGKAIAVVHPEFKQEIMVLLSDGVEVPENKKPDAEEDDKCIRLTMPPVDKKRRDVLLQGVELLYREVALSMDHESSYASMRLDEALQDSPADEVKEAQDTMKDICKDSEDKLKGIYEDKKKEVQDAYKEYQQQEELDQSKKQQEDSATNTKVAKSMKLPEAPKAPDMKMPEMPKAPDMKMPEMPKAPK